MHTRYPRAAVATVTDETAYGERDAPAGTRNRPTAGPRDRQPTVLWASWAMPVREGRLVAMRLKGDDVEVAVLTGGADRLRWVPASSVLTERRAEQWRRMARFTP